MSDEMINMLVKTGLSIAFTVNLVVSILTYGRVLPRKVLITTLGTFAGGIACGWIFYGFRAGLVMAFVAGAASFILIIVTIAGAATYDGKHKD